MSKKNESDMLYLQYHVLCGLWHWPERTKICWRHWFSTNEQWLRIFDAISSCWLNCRAPDFDNIKKYLSTDDIVEAFDLATECSVSRAVHKKMIEELGRLVSENFETTIIEVHSDSSAV